jgi:hypothetical protein
MTPGTGAGKLVQHQHGARCAYRVLISFFPIVISETVASNNGLGNMMPLGSIQLQRAAGVCRLADAGD